MRFLIYLLLLPNRVIAAIDTMSLLYSFIILSIFAEFGIRFPITLQSNWDMSPYFNAIELH